jgi:hypothetical protein
MNQLRTAHIRHPDLASLSVYVRNNIARRGTLREGDPAPGDVVLYHSGTGGEVR